MTVTVGGSHCITASLSHCAEPGWSQPHTFPRLPVLRDVSPFLRWMVVDHVDDFARWVQGSGGREGNAEVTRGRRRLRLGIVVHGELRFRDAPGASHYYPPLGGSDTHQSFFFVFKEHNTVQKNTDLL